MPKLLKKDTIRLLESSIESLSLAQLGICQHRKDSLKIKNVRYSPEVGLIGCAIEMSMSSVLIQAYGNRAIIKDGTDRYKTAAEILSDFKKLLINRPPVLTFLTSGISDPEQHISSLLKATLKFKIAIAARANGFHAGIGVGFEVVCSVFEDVSNFLSLLSESINFKPYLCSIPKLIGIQKDPDLLIENLISKLKKEKDLSTQKELISSLYLILPEIPDEAPDWLEKFEEFQIKPKKSSLTLYTGFRISDIMSLRMEHISYEDDGEMYVCKTQDKTGELVSQYFLCDARKYVESRLEGSSSLVFGDFRYSSTVNDALRDIVGRLRVNGRKIYKKVTLGSARNSHATWLYNATGDIDFAKESLGHSSHKYIGNYVNRSKKQHLAKLKKVFVE